MYVTLLYRGKQRRFLRKISLTRLLSLLVLSMAAVIVSSRSTMLPAEHVARVAAMQTGLIEQQEQYNLLQRDTQHQLEAMLLQLKSLHNQIENLDNTAHRLIEQTGLDASEFKFITQPQPDENASADVANDSLLARIESELKLIHEKQQQMLVLESILMNHHINDATSISGRPIKKGWLSSYYGTRKDPFTGLPAMHKGIDFAGVEGEPILATGAGIVVWSGDHHEYGNLVEIDHGQGMSTRYAHNKDLLVRVGDVVTKGQKIATMGDTGRSTGPHLHYEVLYKGRSRDPLPYVLEKKK
jgi:murein DD-endopeptidase MepM/ murein hydrolase activator NlpD